MKAHIMRVIRESAGACSMGFVSLRLKVEDEDIAKDMVELIRSGKLVECPTVECAYGLPEWYK